MVVRVRSRYGRRSEHGLAQRTKIVGGDNVVHLNCAIDKVKGISSRHPQVAVFVPEPTIVQVSYKSYQVRA